MLISVPDDNCTKVGNIYEIGLQLSIIKSDDFELIYKIR